MTKEEIANIKRIDTSLNVFRKKMIKVTETITSLTEDFNKKLEPLQVELKTYVDEIDFWQKPVIDRYGKTTEELLHESGEETASDTSTEEESEKVNVPDELEKALAAGKPISEQKQKTSIEEEPEDISSEENMLGLEEFPEEWN